MVRLVRHLRSYAQDLVRGPVAAFFWFTRWFALTVTHTVLVVLPCCCIVSGSCFFLTCALYRLTTRASSYAHRGLTGCCVLLLSDYYLPHTVTHHNVAVAQVKFRFDCLTLCRAPDWFGLPSCCAFLRCAVTYVTLPHPDCCTLPTCYSVRCWFGTRAAQLLQVSSSAVTIWLV